MVTFAGACAAAGAGTSAAPASIAAAQAADRNSGEKRLILFLLQVMRSALDLRSFILSLNLE
jgi:hypothetical protein